MTFGFNISFVIMLLWFINTKASATYNKTCDVSVRRPVRYWSRCEECSINERLRCPSPYIHTSSGAGVRGCRLRIYFGSIGAVDVKGCQHTCDRMEYAKECCSGYWGSDCQACPGNPVCSSAGKCFDKMKGNGTCSCQRGFHGTACEICTNTTMFGPSCNQQCGCERGVCQNRIGSSGQCKPYSCQTGYVGMNCSIRLPACHHSMQCQLNADCFNINGTDTCVCDPGYSKNGSTCLAINPCHGNSHGCHRNANCIYTAPGKHRCECAHGYRGDGIVCVVIDPCQTNNGGCGPNNSTTCNFLGPARSNCTCLPGFFNDTNSAGCSMINLCNDGNRGGCDVNAECFMPRPGEKRCSCKKSFRGNGTVCYGNLAKRVVHLNLYGPPGVKGLLNQAVSILMHSLARPLVDTGPFTLFLSIDAAMGSLSLSQRQMLHPNNTDFISQLVNLHVIAADLDSVALKRTQNLNTLQGTKARITVENGSMIYTVAGSPTKAHIIASNFLAGNGMIHVLNKFHWYPGNYTSTRRLTLLEIFQNQNKYEQFERLLELTEVTTHLTSVSGVTVLVPDNSAFLKLDNVTFAYLTTTAEGKTKLRSLLKYHIIQGRTALQNTDLISLRRVTSIEGESTTVQVTPQGAIVFNGKARIIESNIFATDGIIHRISDLLIPHHILPLLPNYVYTYRNTSARATCYRCDTIPNFPNKGCPKGYNPSARYVSCRFILSSLHGLHSFTGCKVSDCIKTTKIKDCSSGFFGSTCRPCPGPIGRPCNLHGMCQDKIRGSGLCTCQPLFTGTACEKCVIANKFGPSCNRTCTCVNGSCDSGISGNGRCKPNSCRAGYYGDNCDVTDTPCIRSSRQCHIHSRCVNENGTDVCKCNPGYEGSGILCSEINLCTKPNRGGCHKDAVCTKTGPGTNNCTCGRGFRGDGIVCVGIDPCKEGIQLTCHSDAECRFIGPGQGLCVCKKGYTGSGQECTEINNCLVNNGGCSSKAKCHRVGPGKHQCTCSHGYIGNGYSCIGSVAKVIEEDRRLTSTYKLIKKAHLDYFLSMEMMNFTMFAPSNEAFRNLDPEDEKYWSKSTPRSAYLIEHHLANVSYSSAALINLMALRVMNGQILNISRQNNMIILNSKANVTQADIGAANGMVHIIDQVLVPGRLPSEPILPNVSQVLSNMTEFSDLNYFLQGTNLIAELDKCNGCTIFAPTNSALMYYRLVQHKNITLDVLKYHVILKYIAPGHYYDGQQYSTKLGQNYLVKLTKPEVGRFEINSIPFDINSIRTKQSIVYKLSKVLEPTKSRCDVHRIIFGFTSCRWCLFNVRCPSPWTLVQRQSCTFWGFLRGCRSLCKRIRTTPKCCSGFWGSDCQACPGDVKSACYGHGICSDGVSGTGHCQCSANFTGTACEKCRENRYGRTCSSVCACSEHGRCNNGIKGDGSCVCEHGWKGPRCNKSANFKNCLPVLCNTLSTCRNSNGAHKCMCDVGYIGNGTYCREIHACDIYNGGCHSDATCSPLPNDPSRALCTCKKGYTGDGTFCSGIDLCQTNKGGCHVNATCSSTGPGKRTCHCNKGFLGNGVTCKSDNPCLESHGGCSLRAICTQTGPGQRRCTCGAMYVGNGENCVGSSMEILQSDPDLSKLDRLYEKHKLDKFLRSNTDTSIVAPTNEALKNIERKRKRRSVSATPNVQQYLRYHIIACVRITNQTILNGGKFVSLLGPPIWLKKTASGIFFVDAQNKTANVTNIFMSANGYVFKVDTLLTPPVDVINTGNPSSSYFNVAKDLGYTTATSLLKSSGLENIFSNPLGRPYLVFISTNQAIDKLPSSLKTRLTSPGNIDELRTYIKYHVVANSPANLTTDFFVRGGGGVELTTLQGNTIFVSCKGGRGDLYVNGISRISKRDIQFDGGVGFAVDDVILPLGLGGNCDRPVKEIINGSCGNCLVPVSCPSETTLIGVINHNCMFDGGIIGCQPVCMRHKVERKCCSNYYGSDCRACPGGIGTPCFARGQCDDGLMGTGMCNCTKPFYGTACERCLNDTYCPVPVSCNDNVDVCHVYATCSDESGRVNCTCRTGYQGDGFYCQMIDLCATNNGDCGVNATCHFQGPNKRRCQCKPGFQNVNYRCQAFEQSSPCSVNHGGCSDHADCTNSNGAAVCKCWNGYAGNGITCHGNLIQSLEDTIKVSAFYQVLHHLKMSGDLDGRSLFTDLQKESNTFTVFAPINSAVKTKGFSLTRVKNHIVPSRIKLSTLSTVTTFTNLLGTKIMIRKAANGDISINGAAHVLTDVQATNGVIFVVDQVIPISGPIPPQPITTPFPTTVPLPTTLTPSSKQQTVISVQPTTKQPSTAKSVKSSTEGIVAGIVISILLVIAIVGGIIWYHSRKSSSPGPSFRYRKESETIQYDSEVFQDVPNLSYGNPVYGDTSEPGPSEITIREEPGLPSSFSQVDHTEFANPIYLELKDSQSSEKSPDEKLTLEDGQLFPGTDQKC